MIVLVVGEPDPLPVGLELKRSGGTLLTATSAEDAVEVLRTVRVDVVAVDFPLEGIPRDALVLPRGELLAWLRSNPR